MILHTRRMAQALRLGQLRGGSRGGVYGGISKDISMPVIYMVLKNGSLSFTQKGVYMNAFGMMRVHTTPILTLIRPAMAERSSVADPGQLNNRTNAKPSGTTYNHWSPIVWEEWPAKIMNLVGFRLPAQRQPHP